MNQEITKSAKPFMNSKRLALCSIILGFLFCLLGVLFMSTIGWFTVPLAFGIGITLLIAGSAKLVIKPKK